MDLAISYPFAAELHGGQTDEEQRREMLKYRLAMLDTYQLIVERHRGIYAGTFGASVSRRQGNTPDAISSVATFLS